MTDDNELRHRLAALEEQLARTRLAGYGKLYAAFVPMMVTLTLVPYYEAKDMNYLTLWEMVPGGGVGVLGLLLVLTLLTCLLAASFRPDLRGAPVGVAIAAGLLAVVFLSKMGTVHDPNYSTGGWAALSLSIVLMLLGITHAIHLRVRPPYQRALPSPEEVRRALDHQ